MNRFEVPLRSDIRAMAPYVPGKPIEEVERELGLRGVSKLASNENPLGPSPKALEAVRLAASELHRYPDGSAFRLRRALSAKFQQDEGRILLGNGSNELLVLLAQCVLAAGDEVVFATPSFVVYGLATQLFSAKSVPVPVVSHLHDLQAFREKLSAKTRLVFICNPNNPTGTALTLAEVETFLKDCPTTALVVLDEAYYEYVALEGYRESLALLDRYPNLAVLRTFSKAYGLAGLRVGYGFAHPDLVETVQKARQPFNVNSLSLAGAEAALGDEEHVRRTVELNVRMRTRVTVGLREMGFEPAASETNFVYFETPHAVERFERVMRKGFILRPMGLNALRVTTGTEEETEGFLRAMKESL
jgi:histidinol-phosphate aminotransferase